MGALTIGRLRRTPATPMCASVRECRLTTCHGHLAWGVVELRWRVPGAANHERLFPAVLQHTDHVDLWSANREVVVPDRGRHPRCPSFGRGQMLAPPYYSRDAVPERHV